MISEWFKETSKEIVQRLMDTADRAGELNAYAEASQLYKDAWNITLMVEASAQEKGDSMGAKEDAHSINTPFPMELDED